MYRWDTKFSGNKHGWFLWTEHDVSSAGKSFMVVEVMNCSIMTQTHQYLNCSRVLLIPHSQKTLRSVLVETHINVWMSISKWRTMTTTRFTASKITLSNVIKLCCLNTLALNYCFHANNFKTTHFIMSVMKQECIL